MSTATNDAISIAIASAAHELTGNSADYDPLLALIGGARFVLLGEATHGTREFYEERAKITQRLIRECGFSAVAVEADWPDAYRAHRYARGENNDANAEQALSGFKRFPTWMWRNPPILKFIEWLRAYNAAQSSDMSKAGFYGLDLYSLYASMEAVLQYLDQVDPAAARRARDRYNCFERFDENSEQYAYATAFGMSDSCEEAVIAQLKDLRNQGFDTLAMNPRGDADELFYAEQNARLVVNAERYYRAMFRGRVSSWNLRDQHMMETLEALDNHLSRERPARIVVWAHNSHLGDARATEMGQGGEWNLGQLSRERYGDEVKLIGSTTHHGSVTAASDWGEAAERKRVRPAMAGSYESLLHQTGISRFLLPLQKGSAASQALSSKQLERAIGVLYLPASERASHYFEACLPAQFDAILHFDETSALQPLERSAAWETGEAPETYPVGI